MTELLLNIEFGAGGNSAQFIREGWAEQEPTHRWTMGRESRVVLPEKLGPDCVLSICATPCIHLPDLRAQAVMLAIDDRLLASAELPGLRSFAFRLPAGLARGKDVVLSIMHLHHQSPRAENQMRDGQPLGLMVHSIRLYRLSGKVKRPAVFAKPAVSDEALALRFESLGQGCQFGQIQRQLGADPISLLRFVDTVTSRLVDGLVHGFAGIDRPGGLSLEHTNKPRPTYQWHQRAYGLSFDTLIHVDEATRSQVIDAQLKRLTFLRRKFLEDLQSAEKIYVLTRSDCLSEPEALAVFCALNIHAPNTLLWTVFGDETATGQLDEVAPGFLRGELGWTNEDRFAPLPAWRLLLEKC
jgi:hypothetical protein